MRGFKRIDMAGGGTLVLWDMGAHWEATLKTPKGSTYIDGFVTVAGARSWAKKVLAKEAVS